MPRQIVSSSDQWVGRENSTNVRTCQVRGIPVPAETKDRGKYDLRALQPAPAKSRPPGAHPTRETRRARGGADRSSPGGRHEARAAALPRRGDGVWEWTFPARVSPPVHSPAPTMGQTSTEVPGPTRLFPLMDPKLWYLLTQPPNVTSRASFRRGSFARRLGRVGNGTVARDVVVMRTRISRGCGTPSEGR